MPNLQEIVNKIFGLDPTKEYDFTVNEKQSTPPSTPVSQQVPPTVVVPPTMTAPESSTVESSQSTAPAADEKSVADIANLQARIKTLEAANLALINKLPVQKSEEKSVEELIYELYTATAKKGVNEKNGTNSTSTGTQS